MITRKEVLNLARLSYLNFSEEELTKMQKDMGNILNFVAQINEANAKDLEFDSSQGIENAFREDIIEKSFSREEILSNAKNKDGFFYIQGGHLN